MNDYLSTGYGQFYGALSRRLTQSTGLQSLVIDQCGLWPVSVASTEPTSG